MLPNTARIFRRESSRGVQSLSLIRLSLSVIFMVTGLFVFGQCPNNNAFWIDMTPTGPGNTQTTTCIWGGEYVSVSVCQGASYTFSTCGSGWDTQITVYQAGGATSLAYNDDGCGLQSTVTWTSTFSGVIWVLVDAWPCTGNSSCATLNVTQNTPCVNAGAGCTDPAACNYNPSATTNDGSCCYDGCVTLFAGGGTWDGEISWSVYDGGTLLFSGIANDPNGIEACLPEGCYTLNLNDSFGDGWNGAVFQVIGDNGSILYSTTLGSGYSGTFTMCTTPPEPPCYDPDPSGCPDIELGADIVLPSCFDPCQPLTVAAEVFETGSTTSYTVCSIDYAPPYPFNAGTGFSIGVDDVWTGAITLPFNFCFFGNVYSQCVVGSNGLISFNTAYANGFCPWAFTATCPSAILPLNAIFGPYHDIDPSVCGDARYAVLGAAPCRVFVVNFDNVCHFSCTSIASTHQIVLYETTNVIEVYIQNKPTCNSWNSGNAVVGIQNAAGTTGFVAPGRQTGPWSASNEAWRFTPDGPPNFVVNWYEQGSYLGSGLTIDVCPAETQQSYVAEAVYTNCDGSTVVVDDIVQVSCAMILLPVEWLRFEAVLSQSQRTVHTTWETGSETNNAYFTVQRSGDGLHWEDVGEVPGAGNSLEPHAYALNDHDPLPGVSYYRVRQTDFNGNTSFSEMRVIERDQAGSWSLYPNPGNGSFNLWPAPEKVELRIYDSTGRLVAYDRPAEGMISLTNAAKGYYLVELLSFSGESLGRLPLVVE